MTTNTYRNDGTIVDRDIRLQNVRLCLQLAIDAWEREPDLLAELETRAGNLETIAAYLQRWQDNGAIKPDNADTPALDVMITGLLICAAETRAAIAKAKQPKGKTGQILTIRLSETNRYIDRATGEAFEEPPDTRP